MFSILKYSVDLEAETHNVVSEHVTQNIFKRMSNSNYVLTMQPQKLHDFTPHSIFLKRLY